MGAADDLEVSFVSFLVVRQTQSDQIIEVSVSAVGPKFEVMNVLDRVLAPVPSAVPVAY